MEPSEQREEESAGDVVEVCSEPLDLIKYVNAVRDARAGAIATFAGTTRNSFEGREVVQLEYEAYVAMAIRQMYSICSAARTRWNLIAVSCAHRVGIVPIGQESVFVAVSSAHRADALHACHFIIDEIKSSVPIWKKEIYADGQVWKENAEFFAKKSRSCGVGSAVDAEQEAFQHHLNNETKDHSHYTGDQGTNKRGEQDLSD